MNFTIVPESPPPFNATLMHIYSSNCAAKTEAPWPPGVFQRGSSRCQGSLADVLGSPEEDAVCWEEKSALGRLKCSAKNGHRVERGDAVSTFGVKHGPRLMETPGVPHVADTPGDNVNNIAEGFHCLLVSEWRIRGGLWRG